MNFEQLVALCQRTHQEIGVRAARAVDAHLVVRNWLFGHYIVEYEQRGADRAEYGARFLQSLGNRLKPLGIKGTGPTNLKLFRQFYLIYRGIGQTLSDFSETLPTIGPTLSDQSALLLPKPSGKSPTAPDLLTTDGLQIQPTLSAELLKRFPLGWSQYVELLTIDSPDERRFYEIEAAANHWSVRELQRQIASSLYERLALSRDKEEIRRLLAPTVRHIPAQGSALGHRRKGYRALKGRSKNGFRPIAPAPRYTAPSGLDSFLSARPRALPWAGMVCPVGAQELPCGGITRDLEGGEPL